jgi:hypothetical protein
MDFAYAMQKDPLEIPSFMSVTWINFEVESVLTARLSKKLENHLLGLM